MTDHLLRLGLQADPDKILQYLTPSSHADALALASAGVFLGAWALRPYTWDRPDPYAYKMFERVQEGAEGAGARGGRTRNIAKRAEELGKDVIVFWGSQSGTAEGFANRLARELPRRLKAGAMAADLSDYDAETVAELSGTGRVAVFVMSTYGEGDPSDNATPFCEWLGKTTAATTKSDDKDSNNKTPPPLMSALRYAAFGLGNSDYRHYNRVIDQVTAALEAAGAPPPLAPTGRADDKQGTTEEDFLAWKDDLYAALVSGGFAENDGDGSDAYEPAIEVIEDPSLDLSDLHAGEPAHDKSSSASSGGGGNSAIRPLRVREHRELFAPASGRNCLHMELDLRDQPELTYKTGDHLAVWPVGADGEVELLLSVLGLAADPQRRATPLLIRAADPAVKTRIPSPTTIDALLRYYLEVGAPVSRDAARGLARFAPSAAAREFLVGCSRDRAAYAALSAGHHITVARLLVLASRASGGGAADGAQQEQGVWSALPLSYLVEILPRTQPRYYSISSSSVTSPRAPTITALVANTELPSSADGGSSGAVIPGLASNYLHCLTQSLSGDQQQQQQPSPAAVKYALGGPGNALEGGLVHAHIRRSKFKLPALSTTPLVMIAAGTGLAPFRGFVAERERLAAMGKPVGKMVLVFGCRRPDEDYIYRDEVAGWEASLNNSGSGSDEQEEKLLEVVTAFSRAADLGHERRYVQDRVWERRAEVCRLLEANANLYICGRASMARDVTRVVGQAIAAEKGAGDEAEAREWVDRLKRTRKWQEDVWG